MNYTELDGKITITEQGRNQIRSLLASKGSCLLNIFPLTGWSYQRLYRIVRGMQPITREELESLNDVIVDIAGHGIIDMNDYVVGRVS